MPYVLQSIVHPAGVQAGHINWIWWVMLGVTGAVYVLVLGATVLALVRGRSDSARPSDRSMTIGVAAATAASVAVLLLLLGASVVTGNAVSSLPPDGAMEVKITGARWWWRVEYAHPVQSQRVTTANELHIPVGRTVAIALESADVIHSFWVPPLHGKRDLVPGRTSTLVLRADRAGEWRGQCAEFCGLQHAHMRMIVVAHEPAAFDAWYAAQLQPAALPQGEVERRGRDLVERGTCAMCHAVQGTAAGARMGPDLTHLGSRGSIGAGTLSNTPGDLARWIADSHAFKPGNLMPPQPMSDEDLRAVVAYLGRLR